MSEEPIDNQDDLPEPDEDDGGQAEAPNPEKPGA